MNSRRYFAHILKNRAMWKNSAVTFEISEINTTIWTHAVTFKKNLAPSFKKNFHNKAKQGVYFITEKIKKFF